MPKQGRLLMGSGPSHEGDKAQDARSSPRSKLRSFSSNQPLQSPFRSGQKLSIRTHADLKGGKKVLAGTHSRNGAVPLRLRSLQAPTQRGGQPESAAAAALPARQALPADEVLRTVRPRPLHIIDKVKVFWGQEAPGLQEVDGGSFAKWLCKTEEELQQGRDPSLVVVVGHTFKTQARKAVAMVPAAPAPPPRMTVQPAELVTASIVTPAYTEIRPARTARSSFQGHGDPSREPPYVRYVAPDLDELDSRVEYDLEDDDTAWLTTVRRTVQRPLRQSLTEDLLERLIDRFEKELHAAVVRQPHLWSTDDSGPGRGHVQLDVAAVYPKEKALQDARDAPAEAVEVVYPYWVTKRTAAHRPLLQRLWFEQPWVRAAAKGTKQGAPAGQPGDHSEGSSGSSSEDDSDDGVPFRGRDTPTAAHGRVRHLSVSDVRDVLQGMRGDLERVRTMADQMRRQEKLRKQDLAAWKGSLQQHVEAAASAESDGALPEVPDPPPDPISPTRMSQLLARTAADAAFLQHIVVDLPSTSANPTRLPGPMRELPTSTRVRTRGALLEAEDTATAPAKRSQKLLAAAQRQRGGRAARLHGQAANMVKGAASHVQEQDDDYEADEEDEEGASENGAESASDVESSEGESSEAEDDSSAGDDDGDVSQASAPPALPPRKRQKLGEASTVASSVPGFSHVHRTSASKPAGWMEYVAECRHGSVPLDRLIKLAAHVNKHAQCRPAWHRLAQKPSESASSHLARLRPTFPFAIAHAYAHSSHPPPATTHRTTHSNTAQPRKPRPGSAAYDTQLAAANYGPSACVRARHATYVPGSLRERSASATPGPSRPASARPVLPKREAEEAPAPYTDDPPEQKSTLVKAEGVPREIKGLACMVRYTPSNPQGRVEYHATCKQHGSKRLIQLKQVAAHMQAHAACRPEWLAAGRKAHESEADHLARLAPRFAFRGQPKCLRKAVPPTSAPPPPAPPQAVSPPSRTARHQASNRIIQRSRARQQLAAAHALPAAQGSDPQPAKRSAPAQPYGKPPKRGVPATRAQAVSRWRIHALPPHHRRGTHAPRSGVVGTDHREQGGTVSDDDGSTHAEAAPPPTTRSRASIGQAKGLLQLPSVPLEWGGRAEASGERVLQPLCTCSPAATLRRGLLPGASRGVKKGSHTGPRRYVGRHETLLTGKPHREGSQACTGNCSMLAMPIRTRGGSSVAGPSHVPLRR